MPSVVLWEEIHLEKCSEISPQTLPFRQRANPEEGGGHHVDRHQRVGRGHRQEQQDWGVGVDRQPGEVGADQQSRELQLKPWGLPGPIQPVN